MTRLKKISVLTAALLLVCLSCLLVACGKTKKDVKLYVFAGLGGAVQVDDETTYVKYGDEASKVFEFKKGSKVTLKAIPDAGYEFVKWEYKAGSETVEDFSQEDEIVISLTSNDTIIKAIFVEEEHSYTISYTNTEAYTILPEQGYITTVLDGEDFKFKVNLSEGYSEDIIVKQNGNVLTKDQNNVYTINNVDDNVEITVENVVKNTYQVTFIQGADYTLVTETGFNPAAIEHGDDFKFRINLKEGYANPIVKIKGENEVEYTQIGAISSVYTIKDVKQSYIIMAVADVKTYNVEISKDTGADVNIIQGDYTIAHNGTICFEVLAEQGFDVDDVVVVYNDGTNHTLNPNAGRYTISNIVSNIIISISGVKVKMLDVVLPTYNGLTIEFVNNSDSQVAYNESVYFKITSTDPGLDISKMQLLCNDGAVSIQKDGEIYCIEHVTNDLVITIVDDSVEIVTHTVTTSGEGFKLEVIGGGEMQVKKGTEFRFNITLDGYEVVDGQSLIVKAGEEVLVYDFTNKYYSIVVNNDITITVEGIQKAIKEYSYDLILQDGYADFIDANDIPAYFSFTEDQLDTLYADEFVIKTSSGEEITFWEFVNDIQSLIETVNSAAKFVSLNVGDEVFISWENEEVVSININTSLIDEKEVTIVIE